MFVIALFCTRHVIVQDEHKISLTELASRLKTNIDTVRLSTTSCTGWARNVHILVYHIIATDQDKQKAISSKVTQSLKTTKMNEKC